MPQHVFALAAQKGDEHERQHVSALEQQLLPQHVCPAGAQKALYGPTLQHTSPSVQQMPPHANFPDAHFVVAVACLTANVLATPPASALKRTLSALRRGI